MRPATGSSGSSAPSQRARLRASSSRSSGSWSLARISSAVIVSSSRGRTRKLRPARRCRLGLERAEIGAEVERRRCVVPDVTQQPPATRRPARAVVDGENERLRPDPGPREDILELGIAGQRVTPSGGRIRSDRREVRLRVEVNRPGDVPCVVRRPWPDVDEDDGHSAPRGAMSSSRTVCSGNRASRSAAQARESSAQAITVGPDPDSVAPAQPMGGVARMASSTPDRR